MDRGFLDHANLVAKTVQVNGVEVQNVERLN